MDFEKCKKALEEYLKNYDLSQKEISLKYHHSCAVADLMAELAFRLGLEKEEIILAKVIGLLHDIGRFEQLKKYQSYSDWNVDHALESCNYLFQQGHIRDFVEDSQYDTIIETAIRYHNQYQLPKLKKKEKLFAKMIRDMDKVDIYKQVAIHYPHTFDVDTLTEERLKEFQKRKPLKLTKEKSLSSDAILVQLAFLFDINFEESFDILIETDNFDFYLSTIEVAPNSEKLWRKIREICFDTINQGVKKGR